MAVFIPPPNVAAIHMSPFDWIDARLLELDAAHLRRGLVDRQNAPSDVVDIDGEQLINFSSNDYLGLARDPRLVGAVTSAMDQYGWGSAASPLITGHSGLHRDLEIALAEFEQAEAAVLFPTGFAANVGVITALADANSVIYSDAKNHASIIDGCRLSGASIKVYRHKDVDHLQSLMEESSLPSNSSRQLIVTDTLFSMDGDLAPLNDLTRLAEKHGAMLVADEAHATGVLGDNGRGACERFDVESPNVVRVGTLSKALGSLGGFVVGPRRVLDWITNRSRTLIYSTAAPAAACAAGLAALEIVRSEPERRKSLIERAANLVVQLSEAGWSCGDSTTQIVPIYLGDPQTAMQMSQRLRHAGLLVPGIRPPSVPDHESLLRISLTCDHDEMAIDALLAAVGRSS